MSENLEKHWKKLAREEQVNGDEELAWLLTLEDLHSAESNGLDDRIIDSQGTPVDDPVYDLFFAVSTDSRNFVGVGCIIKHAGGGVIFKSAKCIGVDISHHVAEYKALTYGFEIAKMMALKRINAHGHRAFLYWEVQRQVEAPWAVDQLDEIWKQIDNLDSFSVNCVSSAENEAAIKLARLVAEQTPSTKLNLADVEGNRKENCLICLETIHQSDMVGQKGCRHQFCFNCLSQHVEYEISTNKVPVRCPRIADCARYMDDRECKLLVSPKIFDIYSTRLTEAMIYDSEKVYCPFSGCSAMMCTDDSNAASSSSSVLQKRRNNSAECMECHRLFCVKCHIPWHADLTCRQYQDLPSSKRDTADIKILQVAKDQNWRRCTKCRNLIILAEGCFHMTCRCGNQFCYSCGADYRGNQKICSCPLFSFPQVRIARAEITQERVPEILQLARIRPPWRT